MRNAETVFGLTAVLAANLRYNLELKDPAEVVAAGGFPFGVVRFNFVEIVLDVGAEFFFVDVKEDEDF